MTGTTSISLCKEKESVHLILNVLGTRRKKKSFLLRMIISSSCVFHNSIAVLKYPSVSQFLTIYSNFLAQVKGSPRVQKAYGNLFGWAAEWTPGILL